MKKGASKFIAPLSLQNSTKRPASFRSFSSMPSKKQHVPTKESNGLLHALRRWKLLLDAVGSSFLEKDTYMDTPVVMADSSVNDDVHVNDYVQSHDPTMPENSDAENTMEVVQQELAPEKENATKKGRGKNKCKAIAKLRAGEKLSIKFFQRRGVGMHGDVWARKLGLVYRDPSIIPVQMKKWKELTTIQLDHIWASVKEHFDSPDINEYRVDTLVHMKSLWNKWRSKLHTEYVGKHSQEDALKNIPPMMKKEDWVWLVNDHFFSDEYKEKSARNKANRNKKKTLSHHRGSRPTRQAIYEHVEEFGEEPDLVTIFNYVYAQDGVVKDPAALEKLDEIKNKVAEMPNASTFELIETVFGEQKHGNVVCLGGGVKAKDFTQKSSKKAELINKLRRVNKLQRFCVSYMSNLRMNVHMIEEEVILKTNEAMVIVSIILWRVAMN
ncbi:hypothetical protein LINPERHAP2_LOCUS12183 [Linum perenne]